ncbi:MAG TPA: hypothetical protein VFN52_02535 [Acidiferrobacteraceae bacterium]|nr:hypothetical protein [Acidiferrobacteraceae bacterium]
MPRRSSSRRPEDHDRQLLTDTAARIMAEEGVRDFQFAKRKAAARLNLPEGRNWPGNVEVERALEMHLELFHPELQQLRQQLRENALGAMRFLEPFEPRLVGPVLSGWVTRWSVVQLHAIASTPEDLDLFLAERHIPFTQAGHRYRFGGDRFLEVPVFQFVADETPIEVSLFDPRTAREAPLSPVDGRPMARAGWREVAALLGHPL